MLNGMDDLAAAAGNLGSSGCYENKPLKRHFDADDSGIMESKYVTPTFSANSNRGFVGNDEDADDERPVYAVLDGRNRNQGVASIPSSQPHGKPSAPIIKYVNGTADYAEMSRASGMLDELSGYTRICDDGSVVVGTGPFYKSGEAIIPDRKLHLVSTKNGIDGKARRRSNPLYDFPVTRFPVGWNPPTNQSPCGSSAFCCALQTLVILVSVAALVLAIISTVTGLGRNQEQSIDRKEIEEILKPYRDLYQLMKNDSGHNISNFWSRSGDYDSIVQELIHKNSALQKTIDDLQVKIDLLDVKAANITNGVDNLKKDLSYQISQVPRGLANLTSCVHRFQSFGTSIHQFLTSTDPINLNSSVVLSVVCSTEGGTQALLRFDRKSPDVYSCECSGQMNNTTDKRFCYIHYWTCPIVP